MKRTFLWQIGEVKGEVQCESMQAALNAALQNYLSQAPGLSQHTASLRVRMGDVNYQAQQRRKPSREFMAYNHQTKGNAFIRALWERGYQYCGNIMMPRALDFVLADHGIYHAASWMAEFAACGTKRFFIYPHTARPNLVNDILPEFEGVTAHFVAAGGHVDVMRAYGYEKPLHVVGWSLCPIRPFRPSATPRKVLFAPIHERCVEEDKQANREAFERLAALAMMGKIHLTVRYYQAEKGRGLAGAGLREVQHPEIEYHQIENLDPDWDEIDQADVVVGHQTFAWLAVARGAPTVMFGEDILPHLVPNGQPEMYARSWASYRHLVAYPYDLTAERPSRAWAMLQRAASDDAEIADWRRRMIGKAFDGEAFVSALEGYF